MFTTLTWLDLEGLQWALLHLHCLCERKGILEKLQLGHISNESLSINDFSFMFSQL